MLWGFLLRRTKFLELLIVLEYILEKCISPSMYYCVLPQLKILSHQKFGNERITFEWWKMCITKLRKSLLHLYHYNNFIIKRKHQATLAYRALMNTSHTPSIEESLSIFSKKKNFIWKSFGQAIPSVWVPVCDLLKTKPENV